MVNCPDLNAPLVSIVIPCFNAASFLTEAVESVLSQTYSNIEIVIVDDGSTDNSVALLRNKYRDIHLLESGHRGTSHARNLGVESCRGEFIAFMDADDILHPERISTQLTKFQDKADLGICSSAFFNFHRQVSAIPSQEYLDSCAITKGTLCGTVMLKRDVWPIVGLFNEALQIGEFLEWYLRAQKRGILIEFVSKVLYFRRIHPQNTSGSRGNFSHFAQVLRANLATTR